MSLSNDRKREHREWISTPEFKVMAKERSKMDGDKCVLCNGTTNLQCHHREYPEVFGEETLDMLTTLCGFHHENFHYPKGLADHRVHVRLQAEATGTTCPICDRYWKVYRRVMTTGICKAFTAIHGLLTNHPKFTHLHHLIRRTEDGKKWVHGNLLMQKAFPNDTGSRGDFTKLAFFNSVSVQEDGDLEKYKKNVGLAQPYHKEFGPDVDGAELRKGYWRITNMGLKFYAGMISVPEAVFTINNEISAVSPEYLTWHEHCERAKGFDLVKLLQG